MKKTLLFLALSLFFVTALPAQKIASADLRQLRLKEDSLRKLSENLTLDSLTAGRMRSDSLFVRTLVRSLQYKNSFYYPFDSVLGVSHLYAPDSTFRIFTWLMNFDGIYSRQRGAIQMRTPDGSLRLFPLRDVSEFTENALDSVRTKDNWIGAVYYNIIKNSWNGKPVYTLFGLDDNNVRSKKKWIETLTFDERGPLFGAVSFTFEKDSVKRAPQRRFFIEYKKEATTLVNFIDEQNMILVDHLVSESDEPELAYTLVPDGDSEAFKWERGQWVHIDKAFTYKVDMTGADPYLGRPPVGDPILDAKGVKNEEKLKVKSEENKTKVKKKGD
ncbi:MAG: hypothetical protein JWP27_1162 [Flaviaesturariibacter sp.]|nr:hypothetical protein [Flaviaesturariibacter sp.]